MSQAIKLFVLVLFGAGLTSQSVAQDTKQEPKPKYDAELAERIQSDRRRGYFGIG